MKRFFAVCSLAAAVTLTACQAVDTTQGGAVGVQRARHAVGCALVAEFAGVLAAIAVTYWFFG